MNTKLDSAGLLILGMEVLKPSVLMPVSPAALEDAGTVNKALDQQKLGLALTCVVLYPIVVELVVKHLWEKEHGGEAEHHHDVYCLFKQLELETQCDVEALYDECCLEYKKAIEADKRPHGADAVAVEMANLEEALRWNKEAVKNLKYDLTLRGQSVPTGLFWNSETHWVFPSSFPNFAIKLTRWAASRD